MAGSQPEESTPPAGGTKDQPSSVRAKREELRQHPRFVPAGAKVHLHIRGFLTKVGIGVKNEAKEAVNVSAGGILVLVHSKLQRGAKVQVRLEIEKYKDIIEAEGIVRWCGQSAREESHFYAGIEFNNLPPAQSALIAKMHSWYTSPEYKQKNATRRRLAPPDISL